MNGLMFSNIINGKRWKHLYQLVIYSHFTHFETVRIIKSNVDQNSKNQIKNQNDHFKFKPLQVKLCLLTTLAAWLAAYLYGMFGLRCEFAQESGYGLKILELGNSKSESYLGARVNSCNYIYQVSTPVLWVEYLILVHCAMANAFLAWTWFGLTANWRRVDERFLIVISKDEVDKGKHSFKEQLRKARGTWIRLGALSRNSMTAISIAFAGVHVAWLNRVGTFSLSSTLYWVTLFPYWLYMMDHFNLTMPFNLILSARCVTLGQRSLLHQLVGLTQRRRNQENQRNLRSKNPFLGIFYHRSYHRAHHTLLHLCKQTQCYGRFWSAYLTSAIGCYMTIQCYLLYVLLGLVNAKQTLVVPAVTIALMLLTFVGVQFALIREAARVASMFGRIQAANRRLHLWFLGKMIKNNIKFGERKEGAKTLSSSNSNSNSKDPNIRNNILALLKSESLHHPRLLHSYAFLLFGNYRITNKSFHILISYTCVLFLYINKR